jgi:hypothetical protein
MPEEQNGKIAAGELQSPFLKKLDNFWYHYKWPFLGILFTVIVLIVCLAQCTKNGKGDDGCFMYAGGYTMSAEERRNMETFLKTFAEDTNGDGKIVLGMMDFQIYTKEEIEKNYDKNDQGHVAQLSYNNREAFDQEILAGEATLCFLSPALFEELVKNELEADGEKLNRLLPVGDYATLPAEALVLYKGTGYGIRLSALNLAGYPGFSELPEDTVVCVRRNVSLNAVFGGGSAEAMYEANLALAKRLIAAPAYEVE